MQQSYQQLLRHPEWQKKRLRIMERDRFRCADCGDTETTLNVHHAYYTKSAKPWEYPDESLRCLCERCHATRHEVMNQIRAASGGLIMPLLHMILGEVRALALFERHLGLDEDWLIELPKDRDASMYLSGVCTAYGDYYLADQAANLVSRPSYTIRHSELQALVDAEFARRARPKSMPAPEGGVSSTRAFCGDCRA